MNRSVRMMLFAAAATAALCGAASPALAADPAPAAAGAERSFQIPPQALSSALIAFGEQTRLQFSVASDLTSGKTTAGLSGRYTLEQALQRLLAGTGLTWRFSAANTVIIEAPIPGARTLGAVQVEGVQTDAFAALDGFGAGAGSNGGSDPTATEGTGSLTTNGATVASKTPQSLKDTPQSVTVITSERIQQQNLTDLTSALNYAPGVTLGVTNSLQTFFYSRGFQITAFQIDGGAPLDLGSMSNYQTTPNLAEYDNVQVLRGSDGLFGGAGQPGGVVSLDRKRPLDHEQIQGEVDVGAWNNFQLQADVTGPIGFDGRLRARLVVNDQDRDFFYEDAHQNKAFVYGVVEADLGPNTLVRAGFSYEQQDNNGFNVGGLPRYSDGGDLGLRRSTNLSPPWARWNFTTPEFFAALEQRFNSDWGLKVNFTRLAQDSAETIGLMNGFVTRGDQSLSVFALDQDYLAHFDSVQYAADATINGKFKLFGLEQSVMVGADYSIGNNRSTTFNSSPTPVPVDVFAFNPNVLNPGPSNPILNSETPLDRQEQWGAYVTLNIQPINRLHVVGGFRLSNYWYDTVSELYLGSPTPLISFPSTNDQTGIVTPYASATYGVTPDVTLYASYADVFQSQGDTVDPSGKALPPVTGATYEAGIKGAFRSGKLNASLSVYYTDESNQAEFYPGVCLVGPSCYLDGGAVISQGVDLELSGELLPGWQVQGGYTYNKNQYNKAYLNLGYGNGENSTYTTQQPAHQLKLWTAYTPTGRFSRWTVGGGLRLESARYTVGSACSVEIDPGAGYCPSPDSVPYAFTQGLYTVVDLRAAYKLSSHWQAALDVTNIGDTRYYATAGESTGGNFYGEPRAFMFSLRAAY